VKEILIIKHGALGDVIRTSYILQGLHDKFGGHCNFTWVTEKSAESLLKYHPLVHELVLVHSLNDPKVQKKMFQKHYDWVISLDDELNSCQLVHKLTTRRLTGSYVEFDSDQIKYTDESSPWFDMGIISKFGKEIADQKKKSNSRTHTEILQEILGVRIDKPSFFTNPKFEDFPEQILSGTRAHCVGLNLSAGDRWPSKRMPLEHAIRLCDALASESVNTYLLGGDGDFSFNEQLTHRSHNPNLILCEPQPLLNFAALIRRLDLIVSSDSLALHLAISQGVPNVSFYAPTSAAEIDTFSTGAKVISLSSDYCSYRPDADNSTITSDRILSAMQRFMNAW